MTVLQFSKSSASLLEIGILFPNNQRQHRTLHIQKDVLPYASLSLSGLLSDPKVYEP